MYQEPYGVLDLETLDIYIKSVDNAMVTRSIKLTFMCIGRFLASLETSQVRENNALESYMEFMGLSNKAKATLSFNRVSKGKDLDDAELNGKSMEEVKNFVNERMTTKLVTKDGKVLSDFQTKFIVALKLGYKKYKGKGASDINYILKTIEEYEVQATSNPYLLGRSVSKIMGYPNERVIVNALNIRDKRDVHAALNNIHTFESSYLKRNSNKDAERMTSKVMAIPELATQVARMKDVSPTVLSEMYLKYKLDSLSFELYNTMAGTSLSEEEIHKELMGLLDMGLVGFNLNFDYLLEPVKWGMSAYCADSVDLDSVSSNPNIKFITDKLKPLLNAEATYGR